MSTLPILIPGRSSPVNVPCRLPDCFDFRAFLPSRGVRVFTCWLTSTSPHEAEAGEVRLANREVDPRLPSGFELDEDEQRRADEAAGDVLREVLKRLGLSPTTRTALSVVAGETIRPPIARAWLAEQAAVEAGSALVALFRQRANGTSAAEDIEWRVPNLASERGQNRSAACEALRCYVAECVDVAVLTQSDKAGRQQAEWESPSTHPEDRSLPAHAERYESSDYTLAELSDADVPYCVR